MKRLPGIRHLRYLWHQYWCWKHAQTWGALGIGLGFPNETDEEMLRGIWEGRWC